MIRAHRLPASPRVVSAGRSTPRKSVIPRCEHVFVFTGVVTSRIGRAGKALGRFRVGAPGHAYCAAANRVVSYPRPRPVRRGSIEAVALRSGTPEHRLGRGATFVCRRTVAAADLGVGSGPQTLYIVERSTRHEAGRSVPSGSFFMIGKPNKSDEIVGGWRNTGSSVGNRSRSSEFGRRQSTGVEQIHPTKLTNSGESCPTQ